MDRVVNERPGAEARTDRLLSRRCGRATRRRRGARTHGRGNAKSFNQPLNNWNLSNDVTDMEDMFYGASSFNQPLNSWNVSKVRDPRAGWDRPFPSGSVPVILRSGPCAGPRAGRAAARRGATRQARDSRRKNRDQFPGRARTYAAPTRCGRSATG